MVADVDDGRHDALPGCLDQGDGLGQILGCGRGVGQRVRYRLWHDARGEGQGQALGEALGRGLGGADIGPDRDQHPGEARGARSTRAATVAELSPAGLLLKSSIDKGGTSTCKSIRSSKGPDSLDW